MTTVPPRRAFDASSGVPPAGPRAVDVVCAGGGEMGALARGLDWSSTPLGPVEGWSNSLRTVVGAVLNSRHPMFLFWGPGLVQVYNDAYRPSLGQGGRHPRALGMRGEDFWTDIWDTIGPQIEGVMTRGEATWHEDQHLPIERNGRIEEVYWTYSYSPVRDDDGRINGTLVTCQETTARVLTERRLTRLTRELELERSRFAEAFRQAPSFMAVVRGPSFVFDIVNEAYYQVVGHRDIVGKPVLEALPEVREQGFVELLERVVATGVPFVGRELSVTLVRTAGAPAEERFLDFVYMPLLEADGTRSGVIAHGTDVTDHVLARREIERLLVDAEAARAEAEAANRAKGEFLAVMSHELRTPLNAIGGYAELMELGIHGPVTKEQVAALERIQRSQRHLLGLINGVLNYARVDAGYVHYEIADVPLDEVIATCEALIAPQLRAKGLTFDFAPCDRTLTARADREKVQQIVLNVLSNAVKFTDPGGRVTMRCTTGDENMVLIRVTDTGRGIAPDQLERVFQPFVQVDARLTRTQEGVGLGLAISRDLARGVGGDLTAESAVGKGSTFTLTLPAAG